jgi:hypothetical protein
MARTDPRTMHAVPQAGEERSWCRSCAMACDRVIEPVHCLTSGCVSLTTYTDWQGTVYAACAARVFEAEVEFGALLAAAESGGFGELRCVHDPLPICAAGVQRAFPRRADALGCINPEFAEPDGGGEIRIVARELV